MFLADAGVEDGLSQTLMPNIPKPSPMEYAEWILWCTPTGRHAGLVAVIVRGPCPRQPLGIHMESASIV